MTLIITLLLLQIAGLLDVITIAISFVAWVFHVWYHRPKKQKETFVAKMDASKFSLKK